MPPLSLAFALLPVLASAQPDLKFPSKQLPIDESCEARAFMPGLDRVVHWCQGELVISELAAAKELKRFELPGYRRTQILVTPDGSQIAVAGLQTSDERVWDLTVVDAGSGKITLQDEKFAKVDDTTDGREKLGKKMRKVDGFKEASAYAIIPDPKDPDSFKKPIAGPNGLTVRWKEGCSVSVSRNDQELRRSVVQSGRDWRTQSRRCGVIASADGRHLVFGAMVYSTEVEEKVIQNVADRRKASDLVTQGQGAMSLGRADIALKNFEQAVALDPKLGDAYLYRGLTHLKLEHGREAASDLKQAIPLMDERHTKDLEEVYARAQALSGVQEALKKDPDDTLALRQRMLFRISNEDYPGCSTDFNRAKKLKAALTPQEIEAGNSCIAENQRRAELEARIAQQNADAAAKEYMRKADANRSSSWWADVDLAGMSRAIVAGSKAVGNSATGGSSGSGGTYRPTPASGSSTSGSSGASGPSSAARDQALVNRRVEQKLWDMNNPNNRR